MNTHNFLLNKCDFLCSRLRRFLREEKMVFCRASGDLGKEY